MRIVLLVILLGFPAVDIFVTVRFAQWTGVPAWIWFAAGTIAGVQAGARSRIICQVAEGWSQSGPLAWWRP